MPTSWEKVVEAANAEGRVNIYAGAIRNSSSTREFSSKGFPRSRLLPLPEKAGPMPRSGLWPSVGRKNTLPICDGHIQFDLDSYSIRALDPIKPALLLPEVVDESKWWESSHHYVDAEKRYIFMFMGSPRGGSVFHNVNLVKRGEVGSYWDFLDPKWKGKIEFRDLRDSGTAPPSVRFLYHHPSLGAKFLQRLLGEMGVTLFCDRRVSVDWLATGKFAICFLCLPTEI